MGTESVHGTAREVTFRVKKISKTRLLESKKSQRLVVKSESQILSEKVDFPGDNFYFKKLFLLRFFFWRQEVY